jgi:hypothetical protein
MRLGDSEPSRISKREMVCIPRARIRPTEFLREDRTIRRRSWISPGGHLRRCSSDWATGACPWMVLSAAQLVSRWRSMVSEGMAAKPSGFPRSPSGVREFVLHAFGREFAGAAASMRFYCFDCRWLACVEPRRGREDLQTMPTNRRSPSVLVTAKAISGRSARNRPFGAPFPRGRSRRRSGCPECAIGIRPGSWSGAALLRA